MVAMAGTYNFVSQDNFDKYLSAAGVGTIHRMAVTKTKPDIVVEVSGDTYTFTTKTAIKDVKISFTLAKEYECDPGTGRVAKYLTTMEGDTLITKEVGDPESVATRKFTDSELVMTMTTKGVTATRTFKRA
uniref:Fatty acid-binding protein n=1 Tax=Caligus rogercresseyi TaxID=217165 RepID=C1BPV9_CALRO|nr:Fatty acid-binding protein [Caligus rogercresseyi]|eukprot:TRINITY_DN15643_c0_g1_i1.p1 TRINITY_DN15643_c0_g1~~TRINITY_DN15643_c0_g1_i1.p1  ORF type:complete len:131 (-),score=40.68 TRINITY_DN15643_c0_g1_i1:124-516(-)